MRKYLLVLLLLTTVATTASAQSRRSRVGIEWGLLGGINLTDFSTRFEGVDIKNKMGWQVGMTVAARFDFFAIEPQILYVHHGLNVNVPGEPKLKIKSNSVDVPVLFSLRVLSPLRINVGPVLSVMNDCKYKEGGSLIDFGRVRPTISYTAGIGFTLMRHMLVDLRYNGQFNSVRNPMTAQNLNIDLRSSSVALSFGYVF